MRILLDTHTFLWFIGGDSRLHKEARRRIEDLENKRFLSTASLWEIAIKASLGKLRLGMSVTELVHNQVEGNAIDVLGITAAHLDSLARLPFHHRDPFDRLIIAQSLVEEIPVLGKDAAFDLYPIQRLWS